MKTIIITLNPNTLRDDGYVGPFADDAEATKWAKRMHLANWKLAQMSPPILLATQHLISNGE